MSTTEHELNEHGLVKAAPDAIFTYSGVVVRPLDPDPQSIFIEDIAHSLANQCRWTGHVSKFLSVAEHSLLVSTMLPRELKLAGLLHDATEAYLADLARPIKHAPDLGETYLKYEERLEAAISLRFGVVSLHESLQIQEADNQVLRRETHTLMHQRLRDVMPEPDPLVPHLHCFTPGAAESFFLSTFYALGGVER